MNRVLRVALAAVVLVASLAFAAGCGNEEQNDYVDQVNDVQNAFLAEMTDAAEQPPPTNASQADALVSGMQDALNNAAADLEAIEPPDDVANLHDELVTTMSGLGDQLGELGDALQSGNPQQATQAASQLSTAVSTAQTDITTLIDEINSELQE